ncbi:MAG: GxGYxYP domain-containing protein [Paludibacter sp.]
MIKKTLLFCLVLIFTSHLFAINAVVYDGSGQLAEDKMIAMTLAGIVNRDAPRLYLRNVYETWSYNQTDELWENAYKTTGGVQFTVITNTNALVQYFKSYIKGAITYDVTLGYSNFSGQSFRWQAEAAAMLGGLTDCIPVPSTNTVIDINKPTTVDLPDYFNGQATIQVSAKLELSTHTWNNAALTQEQRYFAWLDWSLDNLLPRCNTSKFYIREMTDWAVNQRMFQLNLAGTEDLRFTSLSDEKAVKIERVMNYLKAKRPNQIFHVYGWMRPEPLVQWISAYGGSFHETLLSNLSWHHVFPVDANFNYQRPADISFATVPLENKYYVLFIASEGDAGNWNIGFQGGSWQSTTRGQVPLAWGFNLQMFEEFPFVGQYYYRTATANDGFMAVSTPLGYAYPDVFPTSYLPDVKTKTTALMDKFKVKSVYAYKHYNGAGSSVYRGITISNNFDFAKLGTFAEQTNAQMTILFDPSLMTQKAYTNYGGLLYNHVNDDTFYADFSNLTTAKDRIVSKLSGKTKPRFLMAGYERFRYDNAALETNDITLPRLKTLMESIKANATIGADVEFVTPEKYTYLLRKSLGLSTAVPTVENNGQKLMVFSDKNQNLQVNLQLENAQQVQIRVVDLAGKLILSENWNMTLANDFKTISIPQKGIFILNVKGQNVNLTSKIVNG